MFKRVVACLAPFLFAPGMALAACNGHDLRTDLSPEEQRQIATRVAQIPFAEGNHWIARNETRTIHLIGTVHIASAQLEPLVQTLTPVIRTSDVLLLESTPGEISAMQVHLSKNPQLTFITSGPTLIDRLPAGDWNILAEKAHEAGIPTWMAAKMRPWFLATALSLPPCLRSDPDTEDGLDKRLARVAKAADIPMGSLEDPLDVIRMLDSDPLDEQLRQMRPYIALIGGGEDGENGIATMLAAYFDERVAEYLEITRSEFMTGSAVPKAQAEAIWSRFMDRLLKKRNTAWLPVIQSHPAQNMVIAVGALHLPGEYGLLNLLSNQGYSVTRAEF